MQAKRAIPRLPTIAAWDTVQTSSDPTSTAFTPLTTTQGRINYRNENDNTGGTRKFNVTQYFTNEGYLLTNGLGNYTRTKPEMSDYSASAADLADGKSAESTENVFTAEISFRLTNGAAEIVAADRPLRSTAQTLP